MLCRPTHMLSSLLQDGVPLLIVRSLTLPVYTSSASMPLPRLLEPRGMMYKQPVVMYPPPLDL